ncbi:hypothetical protein [Emticicia soli]|uniref:Uncharacterized protein n=1 Tax=Emticicia soli TaxID=2027878 RepID=A0ABW5JA53_9BACT
MRSHKLNFRDLSACYPCHALILRSIGVPRWIDSCHITRATGFFPTTRATPFIWTSIGVVRVWWVG